MNRCTLNSANFVNINKSATTKIFDPSRLNKKNTSNTNLICYNQKNRNRKSEREDIITKINNSIKLFLGPISLSFAGDLKTKEEGEIEKGNRISLGPISLSFSDDFGRFKKKKLENVSKIEIEPSKSINNMSTVEWREKYEKNGSVDLWLEDEFNAGSRLVGGRDVHKGGIYGTGTGEGPSVSQEVKKHHITINNPNNNQSFEVEIPEDRYILWEAEDKGFVLPYSCRMGCCTTCAVKIKSGEMYQPQSLGISQELKDQGYGLMCVGYAKSDLILEITDIDEVYDIQFGNSFQKFALQKNGKNIKRDDYALELAEMDE